MEFRAWLRVFVSIFICTYLNGVSHVLFFSVTVYCPCALGTQDGGWHSGQLYVALPILPPGVGMPLLATVTMVTPEKGGKTLLV